MFKKDSFKEMLRISKAYEAECMGDEFCECEEGKCKCGEGKEKPSKEEDTDALRLNLRHHHDALHPGDSTARTPEKSQSLSSLMLPGWASQASPITAPREVPRERIFGDELTEAFMPTLKGGTSEGAKRGWETRRGRSPVEREPKGRPAGSKGPLMSEGNLARAFGLKPMEGKGRFGGDMAAGKVTDRRVALESKLRRNGFKRGGKAPKRDYPAHLDVHTKSWKHPDGTQVHLTEIRDRAKFDDAVAQWREGKHPHGTKDRPFANFPSRLEVEISGKKGDEGGGRKPTGVGESYREEPGGPKYTKMEQPSFADLDLAEEYAQDTIRELTDEGWSQVGDRERQPGGGWLKIYGNKDGTEERVIEVHPGKTPDHEASVSITRVEFESETPKMSKAWEEQKHPRGEGGKFAPKGSGGPRHPSEDIKPSEMRSEDPEDKRRMVVQARRKQGKFGRPPKQPETPATVSEEEAEDADARANRIEDFEYALADVNDDAARAWDYFQDADSYMYDYRGQGGEHLLRRAREAWQDAANNLHEAVSTLRAQIEEAVEDAEHLGLDAEKKKKLEAMRDEMEELEDDAGKGHGGKLENPDDAKGACDDVREALKDFLSLIGSKGLKKKE